LPNTSSTTARDTVLITADDMRLGAQQRLDVVAKRSVTSAGERPGGLEVEVCQPAFGTWRFS
jgi:hypothetical protein